MSSIVTLAHPSRILTNRTSILTTATNIVTDPVNILRKPTHMQPKLISYMLENSWSMLEYR